MTVMEMYEALQDLVETYGEEWAGETEMVIGLQPSYPLVSPIKGLTQDSISERVAYEAEDEAAEMEADTDGEDPDVPEQIVLCASESRAYGERWWWQAAE